MGNLIRFPSQESSGKKAPAEAHRDSDLEKKQETLGAFILSAKEDQAFLELIKEWPCFKELDQSLDLPQIFDMYYDDELVLSQDCVIEFLFHMHDPDSIFDIGNALYTWEEEDREFFFVSLNMHAEL